ARRSSRRACLIASEPLHGSLKRPVVTKSKCSLLSSGPVDRHPLARIATEHVTSTHCTGADLRSVMGATPFIERHEQRRCQTLSRPHPAALVQAQPAWSDRWLQKPEAALKEKFSFNLGRRRLTQSLTRSSVIVGPR